MTYRMSPKLTPMPRAVLATTILFFFCKRNSVISFSFVSGQLTEWNIPIKRSSTLREPTGT